MNSSAPIDSDQATAIESVGLNLRRAREEQNKSRNDAAQEINLRLDQLDALEHDRFDSLPGDAFVRGYLRTYARWLKLDVDQVVADYVKQTGASESVSLTADLNKRSPVHSGSDNTKIVSAAIVVGLFFLGFWLYNANRENVAEPAIAGNDTTVDTFSGQPLEDSDLDQVGLNAPEDPTPVSREEAVSGAAAAGNGQEQSPWQNPFTSAASNDEQLADSSSAVGGVAADQSTSNPEAALPEPVVAAPVQASPAENVAPTLPSSYSTGITTRGAGPDELLFHFREDCWLEVKNNDGRKLYSAARKAGQSLLLKGTAPFYVLVGNAPGVQLSFNGKDVEVRSRNRRNSARLTLRSSR